jgi:hypothetical protein
VGFHHKLITPLFKLRSRGQFVEQNLMLSSNFRCDQIHNGHCHGFSLTLLCYLRRTIDIESLRNRFLKVCYVPATIASLYRLIFILFLLRPLTVLMQHTKQAVRAIKQSILLRCLCVGLRCSTNPPQV